MEPISIVIPVLNESAGLVQRLQRLQRWRAAGHEIILVDGGSQDDTVPLASPLVDKVLHSAAGRARQMNAGAAEAQARLLLFLHIDTRLPECALAAVASALRDHRWGWFDVRLSNSRWPYRMIAWFMNRRSRLTRVCTGDQALFVLRSTFESVGGFPDTPLMEDIVLSKRLRKDKPKVIDSPVITSSRRWEQQGWIRTILLMWRLRLCFFLGVPAERLLQRYYPSRQQVASNECPPGAGANSIFRFRYPDVRILLFARPPLLGKVKTRLQPRLDAGQSLALYRAMLTHAVSWIRASGLAPLQLWTESQPEHEAFRALCGGAQIYSQRGSDLGAKMAHAIGQALAEPGVSQVVLIGTDCPAMNSAYLQQSIAALRQGHDVVIGPAEDGGYVLIGMARAAASVFEGIDWGTNRVLPQTLDNLQRSGTSYHCLEELWDVDRPDDVTRLRREMPRFF